MYLMILALAIFIITYVLIITEWINKMLAAMIGGFALILTGILQQPEAFSAVDWNVIFFLIGMMLVISVLKDTGLFMYMAIKTAKLARGKPLLIMIYMFVITAVVSAFLGSVTTVMILVPILLLITGELKISPVPFIITMVVASNIGGAATMIGDPPNIIIGSATNLTFIDFLLNLTPPAIITTIFSCGLIWLMYRKGMKVSTENRARLLSYKEDNLIKSRKKLAIALVVLFLMLVGLALQSVLGIHTATISMSAGLLLLAISSRKKVEHVLTNDVDWVTIFFFIGLFIIVESLVKTGFINMLANGVVELTRGRAKETSLAILWLSGVFSAFIDNVPFVAAMIPVIEHIGEVAKQITDINPLWWSLALGTCLGGNGTLIGASANIVAVGIAKHNGYHIRFRDFTKVSAVFTLLSLVICTFYILLRYF